MLSNETKYSTKQIKTDHKDLIQDIAFDFYGKRVATASLDQSVKIWNINEKNDWVFNEELKINPGLYKVAWAHPEFGSLLAVACDRYVWIYEEVCSGKMTQSGWIKRIPPLSDARFPIIDLKFAPKYLGLQLVLCAQNGEVRIYQSDILSGNVWSLVQTPELKCYSSCSSCSWSTCFNLPILLALGCDENNSNTDKLVLYEYNASHNSNPTYSKVEKIQSIVCTDPIRSLAFAPSMGKSNHVIAIASHALMVSTLKCTKEPQKYQVSTEYLDSDVSVWRVCWNTLGSVLAAAGDDRKVRLYKCNYLSTWKCFADIIGDSCCSTLIEQNFNEYELLNRKGEDIEQKERELNAKNDPSIHSQVSSLNNASVFNQPRGTQELKYENTSKFKIPWNK